MKTKTILSVLVIVAALLTLSIDTFAQDRPPFVVIVKGDGCSGLIENALVEVYDCQNNLLASGYTDNYGVIDLGSKLPGECPYCVNVNITYGNMNGNLVNITRLCSGNSETVCLIPSR